MPSSPTRLLVTAQAPLKRYQPYIEGYADLPKIAIDRLSHFHAQYLDNIKPLSAKNGSMFWLVGAPETPEPKMLAVSADC